MRDGSRFHLDVLPAVPDDYDWLIALGVPESLAKHAIRITDKTKWDTPDWPRSNPEGYTIWFKDQMRHRLEHERKQAAVLRDATIEEIEDYQIRTPLQRLIQLLKRHRDIRYNGDDDKPTSIIITTLAAMSYDNQASLLDAVRGVVPKMREAIDQRGGVYWVPNPVNPRENFADRWQSAPRKRVLFFEWLDAVEREHEELLTPAGFENLGGYLKESYGPESREALAKFASRRTTGASTADSGPVILVPKSKTKPEREAPVRVRSSDAPWRR